MIFKMKGHSLPGIKQRVESSPAKGKFIDSIKKGNFRDAGKTLKHEIRGFGSGIKTALTDDYNTRSKKTDIISSYQYAKNESAKNQKIKDAGKK